MGEGAAMDRIEASFSTLQEGYTFLRNQEYVTNTKYILKMQKKAGNASTASTNCTEILMESLRHVFNVSYEA